MSDVAAFEPSNAGNGLAHQASPPAAAYTGAATPMDTGLNSAMPQAAPAAVPAAQVPAAASVPVSTPQGVSAPQPPKAHYRCITPSYAIIRAELTRSAIQVYSPALIIFWCLSSVSSFGHRTHCAPGASHSISAQPAIGILVFVLNELRDGPSCSAMLGTRKPEAN